MNNQEAAEMIRDDMKLHHDYLSGTYREAVIKRNPEINSHVWKLLGQEVE